MKTKLLITLLLFPVLMSAQELDSNLLIIKQRLDSIREFSATLELSLDISFINMPDKSAQMHYLKDKPIEFSSDDFVMIPKRGMDFSMRTIFEYPFITIDRGREELDGKYYKVINVIPTDKKADFAIATLVMDTINYRVVKSEITTKKNGTYAFRLKYNSDSFSLPAYVEISFEIERIKIPLNFMGKDVELDRDLMNNGESNIGKIHLYISDYKVSIY